MADDPETQAANASTTCGRKGRLLPVIVVGTLMLVEGAGVFLLTKLVSGAPAATHGQSGTSDPAESPTPDDAEPVEVQLAECRPTNPQSGRLITLHIRVTALVGVADRTKVEEMVEAKKARIEDRVNVVIRSAEPRHLNEPGLETIRRRLKHELDAVFGDEQIIQQVLIPHLLMSGPGV